MPCIWLKSFENDGITAVYPGLESHPSHELFKSMMNTEYGFGGMLTIDVGRLENANALMELMQERKLRLSSRKFRLL